MSGKTDISLVNGPPREARTDIKESPKKNSVLLENAAKIILKPEDIILVKRKVVNRVVRGRIRGRLL